MANRFSVSVGRRLGTLVAAEAVTATLLVVLSILALGGISEDLTFSHRFVLAPVEALAESFGHGSYLVNVAEDDEPARNVDWDAVAECIDRMRSLLKRYRTDWAVAGNESADAIRFRAELVAAGSLELMDREAASLAQCDRLMARIAERAVRRTTGQRTPDFVRDVQTLRTALRDLIRTNIGFLGVMHESIRARTAWTRTRLILSGVVGILVALLLGLHVHYALTPRIRRLVGQVQTFKDRGVSVPIADPGDDEIAVLAHALDQGFDAISSADRERERFLSVVAHELKTPITSLVGYAQAALAAPERADLRERALLAVRRSSARVNRLMEELLLAARTRSGDLPFQPVPVDLAEVVRRVADEVSVEVPGRNLTVVAPPKAPLLADESLIANAIRNLMTYAVSASGPGSTVHVRLESEALRTRLAVGLDQADLDSFELERALLPFGSAQFEDSESRHAVGLFLARDIARLHGGRVSVREDPKTGLWLELEVRT